MRQRKRQRILFLLQMICQRAGNKSSGTYIAKNRIYVYDAYQLISRHIPLANA